MFVVKIWRISSYSTSASLRSSRRRRRRRRQHRAYILIKLYYYYISVCVYAHVRICFFHVSPSRVRPPPPPSSRAYPSHPTRLSRKTPPPPKLGHCLRGGRRGWHARGHSVAPLDRARVPVRGGHRRTRAPRQPERCRQSAADHSSLPFAEHASKRRRASAVPPSPPFARFPA